MSRTGPTDVVRWRAPGRVNLIGEHTDYNGGLALPLAIEQSCLAEVGRRSGDVRAVSVQAGAAFEGGLHEVATAAEWVRYVLGPAVLLAGRGVRVPPLEIHVDSEVPTGAGLSSSAAVICAVVAALDDLLGLGLTAEAQVELAISVENDVVGAPTGGLDQLVVTHAREGNALLCDFADPAHPRVEQVPLDLSRHGLVLLVVDTGVRHRHADGEYAARRRACERAAAALGVGSLGEVGTEELDRTLARLTEDELRRCVHHVATEDERTRRTATLLRAGDLEAVGPLLSASHASLRDDYRVSCPELDLAVAVMEAEGALGARMTGGGFGGCAIGLVPAAEVDRVASSVAAVYAAEQLCAPRWFTARPSGGTRKCSHVPPTG
jgi:galactokinase